MFYNKICNKIFYNKIFYNKTFEDKIIILKITFLAFAKARSLITLEKLVSCDISLSIDIIASLISLSCDVFERK